MIVLGKERNFNQLEREIYEYGCEIARNIMVEILELLDNRVAKEIEQTIGIKANVKPA